MEAQAWTAIGLLAATLIGSLYFMVQRMDATNARIDDLGGRFDARIDDLGGRFDARIDELAREMRVSIGGLAQETRGAIGGLAHETRGLGERFSAIEAKLASFDERFMLIDQRFDLVEDRMAGLSLKLDDHMRRHWG